MKEPRPPESLNENCEQFIDKDEVLLQRACEKIVLFGRQVGVTPEEIISLLDSGMSIRDLLAFLASRDGGLV